jgi:hypothetical protein
MCASMSEQRIEYSSYGRGFFLPVYNPSKVLMSFIFSSKKIVQVVDIHISICASASERRIESRVATEGLRERGPRGADGSPEKESDR